MATRHSVDDARIESIRIGPEDPRYRAVVEKRFNKRFSARPDYVRLVSSTGEVVSVVEEAVAEGQRLVVTSGGHCLEGFVSDPDVRVIIDGAAAAARGIPPRLTVWVPVAVNPGDTALRQLAAQLAVYLAPPGYGEMFSELGFLDLVQRARSGARRAELATAVPVELLDQVCALGSPEGIAERMQAYYDAGADTVAIVPATAEDPCGAATLNAVALRLNANQEM